MDIKPIETVYNGYRFRSRLEARWAVFFDTIGARYEYEPQGFEFEDGTRYLPDFYLPDCDRWIEVKGRMTPVDEHKIELFRNYLAANGNSVLVVVGEIPPEINPHKFCNLLDYFYRTYPAWECFDIGYDFPYIPCVCPYCGKFGFEFDGRGGRICDHYGCDEKGYSFDDPRILEAYRKARQARFEHGETPEPNKTPEEKFKALIRTTEKKKGRHLRTFELVKLLNEFEEREALKEKILL